MVRVRLRLGFGLGAKVRVSSRGYHREDEEGEEEEPRQGGKELLLWASSSEPTWVSRSNALSERRQQKSEHNCSCNDNGDEHLEGEAVLVAAQAKTLKR